MIPIGDLMQSNHPGYRAFCIGTSMKEVYHPVFFDYCVRVCDTFKRHANDHTSYNQPVVSENSLMKVIDCLKAISETDEPDEVFPLRESIRDSCYEFMEYCSYMKSRFEQPTSIAKFYDELGQLVLYIACDYAGVEHS
tara:strand:+ start:484 stop:897 length:414 start_codon:yes stop_codon:yes gene_type:complete